MKICCFCYTNNEHSEREIKEIILFTIASERMILTKDGEKSVHWKLYKVLMNIVEDINKWEDFCLMDWKK